METEPKEEDFSMDWFQDMTPYLSIKLKSDSDYPIVKQQILQALQLKKRIEELPRYIHDHIEEVKKSNCSDYEKTLIIGNINTIAGILQQLLKGVEK